MDDWAPQLEPKPNNRQFKWYYHTPTSTLHMEDISGPNHKAHSTMWEEQNGPGDTPWHNLKTGYSEVWHNALGEPSIDHRWYNKDVPQHVHQIAMNALAQHLRNTPWEAAGASLAAVQGEPEVASPYRLYPLHSDSHVASDSYQQDANEWMPERATNEFWEQRRPWMSFEDGHIWFGEPGEHHDSEPDYPSKQTDMGELTPTGEAYSYSLRNRRQRQPHIEQAFQRLGSDWVADSTDSWTGPQSVDKFHVDVPGESPGMGRTMETGAPLRSPCYCDCGATMPHEWGPTCEHGLYPTMQHEAVEEDWAPKLDYSDNSAGVEQYMKFLYAPANGHIESWSDPLAEEGYADPDFEPSHMDRGRELGLDYKDFVPGIATVFPDYVSLGVHRGNNDHGSALKGAAHAHFKQQFPGRKIYWSNGAYGPWGDETYQQDGWERLSWAPNPDHWVWLDGQVAFGGEHADIAMKLAQEQGLDHDAQRYVSNLIARGQQPHGHNVAVGTLKGGYPNIWMSTIDRNAVWDDVARATMQKMQKVANVHEWDKRWRPSWEQDGMKMPPIRQDNAKHWFEYHCHEGHDSGDTHLWYRTHQPVTVLGVSDADDESSFADRGGPMYKVHFEDGTLGDVGPDELFDDPSQFDWHPVGTPHVCGQAGCGNPIGKDFAGQTPEQFGQTVPPQRTASMVEGDGPTYHYPDPERTDDDWSFGDRTPYIYFPDSDAVYWGNPGMYHDTLKDWASTHRNGDTDGIYGSVYRNRDNPDERFQEVHKYQWGNQWADFDPRTNRATLPDDKKAFLAERIGVPFHVTKQPTPDLTDGQLDDFWKPVVGNHTVTSMSDPVARWTQ